MENPIIKWLIDNPQTVDVVMGLIVGLIVALITAATVAVKTWTANRANRSALNLVTEVIERRREHGVKRAVETGEKTVSKGAKKALQKSVVRAEKKTGKGKYGINQSKPPKTKPQAGTNPPPPPAKRL